MDKDRKLSRRDFCRAVYVGGVVLSLPALRAGLAFGQDMLLGDDVVEDDPEYLELVGADTDTDGFDDTVLPPDVDDPDPVDPSDVPVIDTSIFLPLILNQGAHVSAANALNQAAPTEASPQLLATLNGLSNRDRALQAAIKQLGYREESPYQNKNKFSAYFDKGSHAWCADFASWAFDSTGNGDKRVPWGNSSAASAILDWAKRKGCLYRKPHRGDIFVTVKGSVHAWGFRKGHCGIVRHVYRTGERAGKFLSVEGNTFRTLSSHNLANKCIWVAHGLRPINARKANGEYKYYFVRVPTNPW